MVAGARLSYKVENDEAVIAALEDALNKVDDLTFAMGEIARDFFKDNQKIFRLKGNGKYPALSPLYAAYKIKKAGIVPILVGVKKRGGISGRLRDSLSGQPNKDSIVNIAKRSLDIGTSIPYARYLQEGTKKMPARKILFIDDSRVNRWTLIIQKEVERQLAKTGLQNG